MNRQLKGFQVFLSHARDVIAQRTAPGEERARFLSIFNEVVAVAYDDFDPVRFAKAVDGAAGTGEVEKLISEC